MNIKSCRKSSNLLIILPAIAAAALLLAPLSAQAQAYWLEYQLAVDAIGGPGNPNYFSGLVQGTNLLTTTILIYPNQWNDAYATPSVSYGWLQINAGCGVNNSPSDGSGYLSEFGPGVGGGSDVMFQDTLTVTSATLPAGTQVQIQVACVYYGSITPGTIIGDDGTDSSASVGLTVRPYGAPLTVAGAVDGVNQTNTISVIANTTVGYNSFVIFPTIAANGDAGDGDGGSFSGSVSASIMSQTYVDVLTPGASYTSASGTVYPTLLSAPPTLSIQPAANGVTLLWPVSTTVYRLQQNFDLTTANWVSNTVSVSVVNGTNQVTVSPATGNVFFRLTNP
jgi:hypothetical protein